MEGRGRRKEGVERGSVGGSWELVRARVEG